MSQILDCYKTILNAFNLVEDEGSLISQKLPTGTTVPLKVEGRRLVLPTKEWMKKGFGEDYLPFHPLCEVMSREGTSPVVQMLQRQAKAMISYNVVTLARGLLQVAVDKDTHKDLPIECTDFLKKLANADETTADLFVKLLGAATKKNRLLTVYLKNGGKFDGKKVNRSAIIRFPIMEDLMGDPKDTNVLGVTVAKKHRPTLIALFKLILPFGDNPEEYSFGTTSRVAPYFTALLTAYHKIATVLNQSIYAYGEKLHLAVKPIEIYDLALLDSFAKIYNDIPAFNGNEGATNDQPEEASETNSPTKNVLAVKHSDAETVRQEQISRGTVINKDPTAFTSTVVAEPKRSGAASFNDFLSATNPQPASNFSQMPNNGMMTQMPANGFNSNTGYNGFPQQTNAYAPAPMNFNQPQNSYAPAAMVAPWDQQFQQQQQVNSNPFMAATNAGRFGGNGGTGLI